MHRAIREMIDARLISYPLDIDWHSSEFFMNALQHIQLIITDFNHLFVDNRHTLARILLQE